ncbi:MAG: methylmalonyl-CoA epimerase [Candidatus Kapabacteria bacterium]|jgi:methylmalonyl-CoA/ethylmalonyl-CoA epimerase|nr:methylmalonyl-CoA epimerase [Candidatus Kapabacteria bacterium]
MIQAIDHVGIAVRNLDESMELYRTIFGIQDFHREQVQSQRVDIASFVLNGVRIELTAPTSDDSPIATFIAKRGEGIHHVAFRTNDVQADLERLNSSGVALINSSPVPGAHNMDIAFLHPKSTGGVLMELCMDASHSAKNSTP